MKSQKGFTLIELLVVVAILGILAAVATPNIINMINAGNKAAENGTLASVQTAADAYAVDKGAVYAPSGGNVIITDLKPYLRGTPTGTYKIDAEGTVTIAP